MYLIWSCLDDLLPSNSTLEDSFLYRFLCPFHIISVIPTVAVFCPFIHILCIQNTSSAADSDSFSSALESVFSKLGDDNMYPFG